MVSVRIPLTQGKHANVSIEDAATIRQHKWHLIKGHTTDYAYSGTGADYAMMHRLILKTPLDVDHRNHNGLDNRRSNLREATDRQNSANQRKAKNNTSGYKGVSKAPKKARTKPWRARIMIDGIPIALGCHATTQDAARAYNKAALAAWGEYAHLNIIE